MDIDRLKVVGFKSFADPVEIPIEKGVTGIVGPNGCGKSNLIEALRWAMGETSAKRMRAGGMDDVIFGGTDVRLPRASAEVTISIDNSARKAPLEFNTEDRLSVSRRISRGEGSSYKVNGKTVRAKDVQVLFKDAGVGAGSSALVSQGKVASIISAKPSERRSILEEAAGVAGLSTRRHEAELRLKGTEQNLERADDLEKSLSDQLSSLRRQARQAKRRKDIDGMIRSAEASVLLVRLVTIENRLSDVNRKFELNEGHIKQCMLSLQEAEEQLALAEEASIPAVNNKTDAEKELALAGAKVESVRKEAAAAKSALNSAIKMLERTRADLERQRNEIGSSGEEYEDLKDKLAIAIDEKDYDKVLLEEANVVVVEAKDDLEAVSLEVSSLSDALATTRAERTSIERRLEDARKQKSGTEELIEKAERELFEVRRSLDKLPNDIQELQDAVDAIHEAENLAATASDDYSNCLDREAQAKTEHATLSAQLAALNAELSVLKVAQGGVASLASSVIVKDGYEIAVAAALGEGMNASLGEGEQRWWQVSDVRVSPPNGIQPLSDVVEVPDELSSAISGIGVVVDGSVADELVRDLTPGQIIVSMGGDVWRWDGYRSKFVSGAEEGIHRASRINKLKDEMDAVTLKLDSATHVLVQSENDCRNAKLRVESARQLLAQVRVKAEALKKSHEQSEERRRVLEDKVVSLSASVEQLNSSLSPLVKVIASLEEALSSLPEIRREELRLQDLRSHQSRLSATYEDARSELEKVKRDAETRYLIIQNIEQQMRDFDKRMVAAREYISELQQRLAEGEVELEHLATVDALAPEALEDAQEKLVAATEHHQETVILAKEAEDSLYNARILVRDVESKLSAHKEERARLLAELKASQDAKDDIEREIGERLNCGASELEAVSGVVVADLPDLGVCEARLQRLIRERDGIGTVNLLAEEQLVEVEARLGDANKVKDELREAVRRLRKTISEFEQESRERLTEVFGLVDGHFRDLFARLFGGGHAYLKLSESDDILHAGLEIYACPPGKKLQTMSLMSGGEQALAALALVFAAFLIRPAPVCVLDEVDAALDDSNVDLLCSLVADMAEDGTKFLVVTHHSLTMARCDRLFGVTMVERGVSRVASLDVDSAIKLIDG